MKRSDAGHRQSGHLNATPREGGRGSALSRLGPNLPQDYQPRPGRSPDPLRRGHQATAPQGKGLPRRGGLPGARRPPWPLRRAPSADNWAGQGKAETGRPGRAGGGSPAGPGTPSSAPHSPPALGRRPPRTWPLPGAARARDRPLPASQPCAQAAAAAAAGGRSRARASRRRLQEAAAARLRGAPSGAILRGPESRGLWGGGGAESPGRPEEKAGRVAMAAVLTASRTPLWLSGEKRGPSWHTSRPGRSWRARRAAAPVGRPAEA